MTWDLALWILIIEAAWGVVKWLALIIVARYVLVKYMRGRGLNAINWAVTWGLGQNKVGWPVHWTAQVIAGDKIDIPAGDISVRKSFAQSGNCYYQAKNGIVFNEGVLWGPGCKFISANHEAGDMSQFIQAPPIVIGAESWIGAGAIILPGVEIGPGCIIGAGAVVTKSFGPGLIIAGNPAKAVKVNYAYHLK